MVQTETKRVTVTTNSRLLALYLKGTDSGGRTRPTLSNPLPSSTVSTFISKNRLLTPQFRSSSHLKTPIDWDDTFHLDFPQYSNRHFLRETLICLSSFETPLMILPMTY